MRAEIPLIGDNKGAVIICDRDRGGGDMGGGLEKIQYLKRGYVFHSREGPEIFCVLQIPPPPPPPPKSIQP